MISTVTYNGDGATRVFPVSFEIRGEDYVVVFINGVGVSDRAKYDIINNSIVFRVGDEPVTGTNNVEIVVATSPTEIADLNAPPSGIQTVLENLPDIVLVAEQVVPNLPEILLADDNATIATTKASEAVISASNALTSENNAGVSEDNALASANVATTKANEASASASSASASATTATTQAGIATTKAGEASTSASNASTSASNASTSATNASNSATLAQGYAGSINPSQFVNLTDAQTINGVKTFGSNAVFNANAGVGVIPSSWVSMNACQVNRGSIGSTTVELDLSHNAYFSSGWKYIADGYASNYYQYQGSHVFRGAAAGIAGNTPSFETLLTIPNTGGIKLPNKEIAEATTLDWYEEGTFTPTIVGATTAGVGTYTKQTGTYTRIGNTVKIRIEITWSAHTGTGNMRLAGLPYTYITSQGHIISGYNIAITGQLFLEMSSVGLNLYALNNGVATFLAMDTSASIVCSFTYQV